jgi:uncharacterized membrane protein YfcA
MEWQVVAVFFVTFVASVLSGMAGGGGGYIVAPFLIWLGLTPQQTVVTGKFVSFGLTFGAIAAFRKRMFERKGLSIALMLVAAVIGLASSFLIQKVDNTLLQRLMGILMLAMVPFVIQNNGKLKKGQPTKVHQAFGALFICGVLLLQGLLGGGIGSMVSAILIIFFGTTALEANAMKRKTSLVLNVVIVASLLGSGLINYKFGLFGMAGGLIGGYIGSRTALKKGDEFARYALLVFMLLSGIWLIVTA